ncbi:MAG: hypothetical protein Unbinned4509contig1000_6 [Prokaryotic dsDNA virus sp.]|nr:MAG: hypothetical protein Unbinned4509contig1000_6 [Prokaryotic dsDNA virus sp.]|tara:strand:+ start:2935 stop:3180 length:246 start_codon:yes stop_codon:yes gene_type:complete
MKSEKMGLTFKQKQIYDFIVLFEKQVGVYPTYREIMAGKIEDTQLIPKRVSTNHIFRTMNALVERKWIEKMPNRERGIKIL